MKLYVIVSVYRGCLEQVDLVTDDRNRALKTYKRLVAEALGLDSDNPPEDWKNLYEEALNDCRKIGEYHIRVVSPGTVFIREIDVLQYEMDQLNDENKQLRKRIKELEIDLQSERDRASGRIGDLLAELEAMQNEVVYWQKKYEDVITAE